MPITFRIDKKSGVVFTTMEGNVSISEIIDGLKGLMNHPDFSPGFNGLVDMRNSTVNSTPEEVRRIAELMTGQREKIGMSRSAVVVSKDVIFGMARMFQVFAEQSSIKTELFRDINEARQWLGIGERKDDDSP